MPDTLPMSVVLTVLFAVTATGYLFFAFRPTSTWVSRVSDALHVLMSVVMLAMPWPWGMQVAPPVLQIVLFSLATVFYLAVAVWGPRLGACRPHGTGASVRLLLVYHAVMMAAMVVMGAMMLPMAAMPSMAEPMADSMPGMGPSDSSAHMTGMGEAWTPVSWILVVVFAAATVGMLVRLVGSSRTRRLPLARVDAALLTLMSAGMALAFLPGS